MKKTISLLLSLILAISCLSFGSISSYAKLRTSDDYKYEVLNDGTARLWQYTGKDKFVKIPSKINNYNVSSLLFTFSENKTVEKVQIPDSVKEIGQNAFFCCESLKSIELPSSVTTIGVDAFYRCYNLKEIKFGNSLKYINISAFYETEYYNNKSNWSGNALYLNNFIIGYESEKDKEAEELKTFIIKDGTIGAADGILGHGKFKKIIIPASFTNATLDTATCTLFNAQKEYVVNKNNKYLTAEDGVLFNKDKTVLYSFPSQKEDKEYTIPNGVKTIGQHAFCHAKNIEKVTLSGSVREIGAYAFEDSGLKEIKLNNKLKTIRKGAFSLARLADIYIPKSVKKMGNRMFGESNRYIKIYGFKNSAAQKIAKKYNYKFYIVDPAAPKKTTVRGAKGKITVNYKKVKRAKGFQVKAVSGKKKVVKTYKTEKSAKKSLKGLKKGTYKVKVRAFNTYNGEKIYSPWAVKTVKVK